MHPPRVYAIRIDGIEGLITEWMAECPICFLDLLPIVINEVIGIEHPHSSYGNLMEYIDACLQNEGREVEDSFMRVLQICEASKSIVCPHITPHLMPELAGDAPEWGVVSVQFCNHLLVVTMHHEEYDG